MSRTVALIQARMSSSRFPGKVLEALGGLPMIVFMVRRAMRARTLQDVVVVTSTDASDRSAGGGAGDPMGFPVFVASCRTCLRDMPAAAAFCNADEIVRLTGDCPLVDPSDRRSGRACAPRSECRLREQCRSEDVSRRAGRRMLYASRARTRRKRGTRTVGARACHAVDAPGRRRVAPRQRSRRSRTDRHCD